MKETSKWISKKIRCEYRGKFIVNIQDNSQWIWDYEGKFTVNMKENSLQISKKVTVNIKENSQWISRKLCSEYPRQFTVNLRLWWKFSQWISRKIHSKSATWGEEICCEFGFEIHFLSLTEFVAGVVCCSVWQCVAVCCSVLQCVAVCCRWIWVWDPLPLIKSVCCRSGVLQCVAVCCSVLQCVAVCCNVLQCVAVCCRWIWVWDPLRVCCRCGVL